MSRHSDARLFLFLGPVALVCALGLSAAQETTSPTGEPPLVVETRQILGTIDEEWAEWEVLRDRRDAAEGEERLLIQRRLVRLALEMLANVDNFVNNVVELEKSGVDAGEFRDRAVELVTRLAPMARQRITGLVTGISELEAQRDSASGDELLDLESQLAESGEDLDLVIDAALDNADHMDELGLDATTDRSFLAEVLDDVAATTAARIELSLDEIATVQERLSERPDDADLKARLAAAEIKRDRSTSHLTAAIDMMERLGLETAEYQKLLIQATGQITSDILDSEVALGLVQQWLGSLGQWFVDNGPRFIFKVVIFLLILVVFHLLARLTRKVVGKAVASSKLQFSQLLQKMFISASGNVVRALGLLVALSQLGFALGPVLAGLGIAGFVLGFALQETLGNFAAGLMILIYRPYDVGDMIEAAGVFGQVNAMSMVSTTVLTIDNQTLVVPNGKIWGDVIKNVTAQTVRRVDMVFGISYTDDIPHTEKVLAAILAEHPKVLDDPEPMVKLHNLGDSSVDFIVRPWVDTDDYWDVYWDITREVKMRFDREGISIPFPQRDVHLYEEKRVSAS